MTTRPTGYPQTLRPYQLLRGQQFSLQMPRSILSGRSTRRCFGTAAHLQIMAATLVTNIHKGSSECAPWLKCKAGFVARHLQVLVELWRLPLRLLRHDTGLLLLLVMAACAQGHLNLIPALLSLPMVEHHFIPRTYQHFAGTNNFGNVHTRSHNE